MLFFRSAHVPACRLPIACLVAAAVWGGMPSSGRAADAPAPFAFQKGDTVAIYGNGLADRMQHAPWVESVLQSQLVGLDVRLAILEHLHREVGEQFRPPALLRQMVRAGKLGKKSGEGFYKWDADGAKGS